MFLIQNYARFEDVDWRLEEEMQSVAPKIIFKAREAAQINITFGKKTRKFFFEK